jgi:uncharacterized damage-inducible protein DinB
MDELRRLFDYNRWANLLMLDAAEALSSEELARDLGSSFPSVLDTLVHMLGAEWVWLERWNGTSPTDFPEAGGLTSVAAVRKRWDGLWAEQRALLEKLPHDAAARPLEYRRFSGAEDERELGELMRHVINHASYHRGQLVTLLRQLDKTPPSTDYILFLRERDG